MRGLSLVAASGDHSSSWCAGLWPSRPLLLRSTGSRRAGSVVVAHRPSCSVACGIFPDQGSNPCPLHWQADSQPLRYQGSPNFCFFVAVYFLKTAGGWSWEASLELWDAYSQRYLTLDQIYDAGLKYFYNQKKRFLGTSLVAQWLRICLPMQGTRVWSLVQEDPTCHGATKPTCHNYWAHVPQLLKSTHLDPVLRNKRSHRNEKPAHCNGE